MKKVGLNLRPLKETKAHEYAIRFFFGGLTTVLAGLVATHFGPVVGGFFLAFPAIFPAGATLIESHEKQRLAKIGEDGACRGRLAASIDASGAIIGCIGLIAFALLLWKTLPTGHAPVVIALASIVWLLVSWAIWMLPSPRRLFARRA